MQDNYGNDVLDARQAVSRIIDHILSHKPELTKLHVLKMIEERIKELEGLIDEDAAALLVARELGVPLPQSPLPSKARLPLRDLIPGLQNVRVMARVLKVFDWRFPDGRMMVKITVADETACVDCVAWGETAERIAREVKPGDCILINRAAVVKYKGRVEVKIGEGSTVERIEDPTIPSFDELVGAHNIDILKLLVHEVVVGKNGLAVYGVSNGAPVCVLIPSPSAPQIQRGDTVLIQEPRKLTGGLARYKLTRTSRVFVTGNTNVDTIGFKQVDLDIDEELSVNVFAVRGRYAAVIPSSYNKLTLILCGQHHSTSILTYDENLVNELRHVKPATLLELKGVYYTPRGLRLNPFYHLRILEQQHSPKALVDNLSSTGCYVRTEATVLSVSFKHKILKDGSLVIGAVINVDDGTGYARAVVSDMDHVEELLGAGWDDIREQAILGVLPKLLAYIQEEIRGSDVELEGYLSGDRILAVTDLRLKAGGPSQEPWGRQTF
ncbi:MAG: DUF2240 family protein [Thermofilaceae archaeon]